VNGGSPQLGWLHACTTLAWREVAANQTSPKTEVLVQSHPTKGCQKEKNPYLVLK